MKNIQNDWLRELYAMLGLQPNTVIDIKAEYEELKQGGYAGKLEAKLPYSENVANGLRSSVGKTIVLFGAAILVLSVSWVRDSHIEFTYRLHNCDFIGGPADGQSVPKEWRGNSQIKVYISREVHIYRQGEDGNYYHDAC